MDNEEKTVETTDAGTAPAAEETVKEARKSFSFSLLNIAIFFIINYSVSTVVRLFLPDNLSQNGFYLTSYIPMYLLAFPAYLLLSKRREAMPPEKGTISFGKYLLLFPIAEFFAIAGNFIGIVVNLILSLIVGRNTASTFLLDGAFGDDILVFGIIAVICAPIVEEFVFRKVLIDHTRKYGEVAAILMSGIMFGLFHGNFTQVFYATMNGIFFAYIYVRFGKIQYTIGLHMMMNFWGLIMPRLALRGFDLNEFMKAAQDMNMEQLKEILVNAKPLLLLGVVNYSLGLIGLIAAILLRKKIRIEPAQMPVPKGKRLFVTCCNIGFAAMIAVCGFQFVRQLIGM